MGLGETFFLYYSISQKKSIRLERFLKLKGYWEGYRNGKAVERQKRSGYNVKKKAGWSFWRWQEVLDGKGDSRSMVYFLMHENDIVALFYYEEGEIDAIQLLPNKAERMEEKNLENSKILYVIIKYYIFFIGNRKNNLALE